MSTNYQNSFIPTVPDLEEQEALSQLLLAWYQAGYAAGRYASIRQRKLGFHVCYKQRLLYSSNQLKMTNPQYTGNQSNLFY